MAKHNYPDAQIRLGQCLEKGQGCNQDLLSALRWYIAAYENKYDPAKTYLDIFYLHGLHRYLFSEEAMQLHLKAAELGCVLSQRYVAQCFQMGKGSKRDPNNAVFWFTKAANSGDAESQFQLAMCFKTGFGTGIDLKKAVFWFTKAANQHHAQAQLELNKLVADDEKTEQACDQNQATSVQTLEASSATSTSKSDAASTSQTGNSAMTPTGATKGN